MSEQEMPQSRNEFEAEIVVKAWKDEAFKQELISNPKAVIEREYGQKLPGSFEIRVVEESPQLSYLVIPCKPQIPSEQALSDEQLEAVAGGASITLPTSSCNVPDCVHLLFSAGCTF